MNSQNGCVMSMGLGVTCCIEGKQNLNKKISAEAELLRESDYVPYNIWQIMFMSNQGYLNKYSKFFQDNQSATRMEVNGRNSCTGNSRHIDIRHFFNDWVDKQEMIIVYCPPHLMIYGYLTKPYRENCSISLGK